MTVEDSPRPSSSEVDRPPDDDARLQGWWCLRQPLPVLLRHVVRHLERAVRAGVRRLLDLRDLAAAEHGLHRLLEHAAEADDLAAAAAEEDVVLELVLEVR